MARNASEGSELAADCAFCKIASGEDPSSEIICEDEQWVAFFPSEPATPGHTLVIPRVHVADAWSADPALGAELMRAVIRVGHAIMNALDPDGMNLISSSGTAAEQSVFHLHLHVVPRWENDDIGPIWPPKQSMKVTVKADLAEAMRRECVSS